MFTGLVDDVGTLTQVADTPAGRELRVRCRYRDLTDGESIAVNGACLTVREHGHEGTDAGWFTRDNLPSPTIGAGRWVEPVFAAINGDRRDVYYDDLRQPVWMGDE